MVFLLLGVDKLLADLLGAYVLLVWLWVLGVVELLEDYQELDMSILRLLHIDYCGVFDLADTCILRYVILIREHMLAEVDKSQEVVLVLLLLFVRCMCLLVGLCQTDMYICRFEELNFLDTNNLRFLILTLEDK